MCRHGVRHGVRNNNALTLTFTHAHVHPSANVARCLERDAWVCEGKLRR